MYAVNNGSAGSLVISITRSTVTSAGVDVTASTSELDGRRARRGRNREAVVDALLELFAEGELNPSVAVVAERSGVSLRSVFRYFDDLDEMGRIAIQRHTQNVRHLFDIPDIGAGSRAERIERIIDSRIKLYDAVAPVVRATMLRAPFQPVIAEGLAMRRRFMREQMEQHFAAELATLDEPDRVALSAAIDALLSFETMEVWRTDRKFSDADSADYFRAALDRLLPSA
jgi:AcrR family transcriptional regulator